MALWQKYLTQLVAPSTSARSAARSFLRWLPVRLTLPIDEISSSAAAAPDPRIVVMNFNFSATENPVPPSDSDGKCGCGPWHGLEGYDIA